VRARLLLSVVVHSHLHCFSARADPHIACRVPSFFSAGPTGSSVSIACPAGTYSNATTATIAGDCLPCPAGYHCGAGSVIVGALCTQGYYCPQGTGVIGSSCPVGTYGPFVGLSRVDQCVPCPTGGWCGAATAVPTPCTATTYNALTSRTSITACLSCPGGQYCPTSNISVPLDCGAGQYSNIGSLSCLLCIAGYFCQLLTTSERCSVRPCLRCVADVFLVSSCNSRAAVSRSERDDEL
jgi:hypothetical protein